MIMIKKNISYHNDIIKIDQKTFKQTPNFKYYFVSKDGEVLSLKRGEPKILKPGFTNTYKFILGKQIGYWLLLTYKGPKPKGKNITVSHLDGNKLNNDLSNLIWETHQDNNIRRIKKIKEIKRIKEINDRYNIEFIF